MADKKRKLLIIDDSEIMRESIAQSGEEHGWEVAGYDTLEDVEAWLEANTPDVVLLDWELESASPQQFADFLSDRLLLSKTLLLSTLSEEKRHAFIKEYRLAGFRQKPLNKGSFNEWVALPDLASVDVDVEEVVEKLPLALDLLDKDLVSLWSNTMAGKYPPTLAHRRVMGWLKLELASDGARESVRRLDWDEESQRFLDTRMYRLSGDRYWLARDWRAKGEQPLDQELLKCEENTDRNKWHEAVARLLAERYEITRTRVYKIADLPVTADLGEEPSRLVIPLFQSGGGFRPDVQAWMNTGFLVESTIGLDGVLAGEETSEPKNVENMDTPACKHIDFGDSGTTHVRIPVRNKDGKNIALIALDERSDQLPNLSGFDKEVVAIAKEMASDQTNALSTEQWSLMSGLMDDIASRLAKRLQDGEQRRLMKWHNAISQVLRDIFSQSQRSTEMTYDGLTAICAALVKEWVKKDDSDKIISGHIMGTSDWSPEQPIEPLSAWFIALMTDDTHWQAVAGWGDAYDACRQQGEQELLEPLASAHRSDPWKAVLIQDFGHWKKKRSVQKCCPCGVDACPKAMFGWLAVPMQLDGRKQAMMVVHARHPHYFTEFRVNLLETAAKRLLPLLAAAQREQRARSVFTAAIMHEVKNEARDAVQSLAEARKCLTSVVNEDLERYLTVVQHHLEGLEMLGKDALDVFQLGSEVRKDLQTGVDKAIIGQLGTLLNSVLRGWKTFYEDTTVKVELSESLTTLSVEIPSGGAFKRVLRVLLHNAFRHGRAWVRIVVKLENTTDPASSSSLCITISNLAYGDVAEDLARRLFGQGEDTGGSTRLRGRLGLVVARQLVTEAHGSLSNLTWQHSEGDFGEASIALKWPVRVL